MENVNLPHKKRRHDGNYASKYHSTSKGMYRDDVKNWQGEVYHDENRNASNRKKDNSWDFQINLIGKKAKDPMIHVCEVCSRPILSYGRMIPCKHVFCFSCAKQTDKNCPRCKENMQRIEQCPLGSVWLCSVNINCRRTYLSQRDLQAHINHRHSKPVSAPLIPPPPLVLPPVSSLGLPITVPPPTLIQPTSLSQPFLSVPPARPVSVSAQQITPPNNVASAPRPSSNLITIPIQDNDAQSFPPPPPPGRPANQPQLFPPQGQVDPRHYQQ